MPRSSRVVRHQRGPEKTWDLCRVATFLLALFAALGVLRLSLDRWPRNRDGGGNGRGEPSRGNEATSAPLSVSRAVGQVWDSFEGFSKRLGFSPLVRGGRPPALSRQDTCLGAADLTIFDPPMGISYFKSGVQCYTSTGRPGMEALLSTLYSYCYSFTDSTGLRQFGGGNTSHTFQLLTGLGGALSRAQPRLCVLAGCNCPYLDPCAGINTEGVEGICYRHQASERASSK